MSEKEIRNDEVVGKKLEDLTEKELKELQGQGDTDGELVISVTIVPTIHTVSKNILCTFKK